MAEVASSVLESIGMTRKISAGQANPIGDYPELPELDEQEKKSPELVSYHEKLRKWYYDLRRVLLRERPK